MRGLEYLNGLIDTEEDVAVALGRHFGSLESLYMSVFGLHHEIYKLTRKVPERYTLGRDKFHHVVVGEMPPQNIAAFRVALAELKRLEERIEECRVFGCEVTEEIGKDFDDIKVHKKKKDFLRYMDRHGRHFPNLVAWVANLK